MDDYWSAGQKEVVHIEEFTKALDIEFGSYSSKTAPEYLAYVKSKSDGIARKLKQNNVAVGTTLWFMESLPKQAVDLERIIADTDLSFTNPDRSIDWMPGANKFALTKEEKLADSTTEKRVKIFWDTYVEAIHIMLRSLIKHDVIIVAGADPMTAMVVPGKSMHDEIATLVNRGLTPAQALRTATSIPSKWMKSNTGVVAKGYDADLLILNANPLENIENTRKIDSVIYDGKILSQAQIKQIFRDVRAAYADDYKEMGL
jgi:hypothetical protein